MGRPALGQRPVHTGPNQAPVHPGSVLDNQRQHALVAQVDNFSGVAASRTINGNQGRPGEQLWRTGLTAGMLDPETDHLARVGKAHRPQKMDQVHPIGKIGTMVQDLMEFLLGEQNDLKQFMIIGFVV